MKHGTLYLESGKNIIYDLTDIEYRDLINKHMGSISQDVKRNQGR